MLVCYALENRNPWFIVAFAASCALGSVYGFLQGAWPFGVPNRGSTAPERGTRVYCRTVDSRITRDRIVRRKLDASR